MKNFAKVLLGITSLVIGVLFFSWIKPEGTDAVYAMPFGALGTYACQRLQAGLVEFFGKNIATYRTLGSVSYIKWLLSPQNTAGFRKISNDIQGVPGKKRGVAFRVDGPFCFSLCALNVTCTTNNIQYVDPQSQEIVFDLSNPPFRHCDSQGRPVRLRFKEADLEKYCTQTNTEYISEQIFRYLLRFEEALDAALTTILNGQIGTNAQGEAITNVPIFTAANAYTPNMAALNPEAMWYLDQLYKDIGQDNQFGMLGGTIINKIAQYQKWTTWNGAGLDMSKADAINPYLFYNRNFNSTFGQSDFIIAAPGAQQLVTWNKYKGERVRGVTDLYSKGTIILPTTGLEVDWKWWYDYDCEEWMFEAFLHAELATVPAGGCTEEMEGVNGIMRVHDCGAQPLVPACPDQASS